MLILRSFGFARNIYIVSYIEVKYVDVSSHNRVALSCKINLIANHKIHEYIQDYDTFIR